MERETRVKSLSHLLHSKAFWAGFNSAFDGPNRAHRRGVAERIAHMLNERIGQSSSEHIAAAWLSVGTHLIEAMEEHEQTQRSGQARDQEDLIESR